MPGAARIFNSAVVPYNEEFIGVFCGEQTDGICHLYLSYSKDGINWEFEKEKINITWCGVPIFIKNSLDWENRSCLLTEKGFYFQEKSAIIL